MLIFPDASDTLAKREERCTGLRFGGDQTANNILYWIEPKGDPDETSS